MDLNHRPHAYQACALTSWAIGPKRVTRIGLATTAWKAVVLPLNYTRSYLLQWRGTESNCRHMELQSIALPTELPSHYTVLTGLEPVISCVTGRRDNQLHHRTNCGRRIWTYDLRVMSPTSYQTAPSRDNNIIQNPITKNKCYSWTL